MSRIVEILDDHVTQVPIAGLHVPPDRLGHFSPCCPAFGRKTRLPDREHSHVSPRFRRRQNNRTAPSPNSRSTISTLSRTPLAFASSDFRLQCGKRLVPYGAKCFEPRVGLLQRAL